MIRNIAPIAAAVVLLYSCGGTQVVQESASTTVSEPRPAALNVDRTGGGANTGERACAAAQHRAIVGRPIDEIDTGDLPRPVRVYTVGDEVAMDHQPNRLNVVVGTNGRVVAVKCG